VSDQHRDPERPSGAQQPHAWMPPGGAEQPPSGWPPPSGPPPSGPPLRAPLPGRAAVAALVAGLLASVAVADEAVGLGVVVCGAAIAVAAWLGRAPGRGSLDAWSRVWAALAAGLLVVALLRDAEWVVVPCLFGSVAFASLALAGGRGWSSLRDGLIRVGRQLAPGALALARRIGLSLPLGQGAAPALRGAGIAAILLSVFGVLFASGDAAFAHLADEALPSFGSLEGLPVQLFWFTVAACLAAGLATVRPTTESPATPAGSGLRPTEWGIALGALVALFVAFVAVQATVLFGKDDYVLKTAGLTYADYAREGFVQLLVAAALTIAVVGGALRWARTETRAERLALRVLLGALAALTLVVLASAAHRLDLYQDAFGATRPRLFAAATIVLVGAILALLIAAVASDRFGWLPRACVLATGVALLGFTLIDPDRRIAERNVERFEETGDIDLPVLRMLSADAVPALAELPPRWRAEVLQAQRRELEQDDGGWGGLNLSRERARDELARTPIPPEYLP
jgi:hypothetical protein